MKCLYLISIKEFILGLGMLYGISINTTLMWDIIIQETFRRV